MKKILVVGELNQTVSNINRSLITKFETQLCMDSYERVKAMTKVFSPDMAIICMAGVGELDDRILDFFSDKSIQMPILLIGTMGECKFYQKYYENVRFDFLVRPFAIPMLVQRCMDMLEVSDADMEVQTLQEPEKEVKLPGGKKHILAVDDSGILLRSVKNTLEERYEVSVATSGMLALTQARKKTPDLILLDYDMPGWDGKKTLEVIRKDSELKDIPVVFLTAVADKEHIAAVLELRPSGYLLKPVEPAKLFDSIEKVLNK